MRIHEFYYGGKAYGFGWKFLWFWFYDLRESTVGDKNHPDHKDFGIQIESFTKSLSIDL